MKGVCAVSGVLISRVLKSCEHGGHRWQDPHAKQTLGLMLMLMSDGPYLTYSLSDLPQNQDWWVTMHLFVC